MARVLSDVISHVYRGDSRARAMYNRRSEHQTNLRRYMEIPIVGDTFEIPIFALPEFIHLVNRSRDLETEAFVVSLYTVSVYNNYKTVDRFMQDVLEESWNSKLLELKVGEGDNARFYYGTHGAVFDKDFNPIMVCSWLIENHLSETDNMARRYKYIQPILRISPSCYLAKEDAMQRWMVNKMLTTALQHNYRTPPVGNTNAFVNRPLSTFDVKVEICNSPFHIIEADTPTISTSNKKLLQVAIDHIEEVIG